MFDLALETILSGVLLAGVYAMASLGLTITFGLLEIPNISHPTFIIVGAYCAQLLNSFGVDPILAGAIFTPVFYLAGVLLYLVYYQAFERRGRSNTLQSFTFFFGVALVAQVTLILVAGVDLTSVNAPYIGQSLHVGFIAMPYRLVIPFCLGAVVGLGLWLLLMRSRAGLALRAVAHDANALRICGLSPTVAKANGFGVAMATAALAGAALIVVSPVDPSSGVQYIGRTFAIVVLAGMGSVPGTLVAALAIGVLESLVITYVGATWAPGVAFAALLGTLAVRPSGIFGIAR